MSKLLSIIVPSYNMEKYLPKCLGSLIVDNPELLQKLDVIVVNDGSKDRTSEIAHDFERRYPGVFRVIDKPNGHYGSCINAALPVANGKYVRILDADDYVDHGAFCEYLSWIESVDADAVIAPFRTVDEQGRVVAHESFAEWLSERVTHIDQMGPVRFIAIHAVAYRRSLFDGGWYRQLEGICYTDCQWSAEPMLRVHSLRYFPKEVTCYLCGRTGQSVDADIRVKNIEQQIQVDLELVRVHANGRPKYVCDGAWLYFERLCLSEVAIIFRFGLVGMDGRIIPLRCLAEFKNALDRIEVAASAQVRVDAEYAGGLIRYDLAQSFRDDSRVVFGLKYGLYHLYRITRRCIRI